MAFIDFGKSWKTLQSAAESAVNMAKEATKDIKIPSIEEIGDSAKNIISDVKDIKIPNIEEIAENAKNAVSGVIESIKKRDIQTPQEQSTVPSFNLLSTRCALTIIYYLMAADGAVVYGEKEKFDAIGQELDPNFIENKESIVEVCRSQLDRVTDPDDYFDVLQDGVENAFFTSKPTADSFVTPKLLVWDLLSVAYSDEHYDQTERKLLKYIVRKTNIEKAVFLEMESSMLTLLDIEKELAWIKTTNRPYLTIEAMVNELLNRKNVIFQSVKDLISL